MIAWMGLVFTAKNQHYVAMNVIQDWLMQLMSKIDAYMMERLLQKPFKAGDTSSSYWHEKNSNVDTSPECKKKMLT